ncbi:MAG: hypothetical protein IJ433_07435 [Ruminococcus sp.]|nr:hypothetical protein [Ruminococcus sp.]
MKKLYFEPDIEIINFCLTSDVLYASTGGDVEEEIDPDNGGFMPGEDDFDD